jgi:DDE superfamily endonuclease
VADAIAGSRIPARSPIEIWFQDEMRVGQKNGLVYQWAKKGTRPRQPKDQRYANAYVFGAICPARDTGTALVLPCANVGAMQHHLDEISRCVAEGAHAVLTLDKAGWHTTRKLQVPSNISLLHLPPRAEPDREHLAVPAPKLSLKSGIPRLRRCRRGVRFSLEQAHRRARPYRIDRHTKLDRYQSRTVKVGIM